MRLAVLERIILATALIAIDPLTAQQRSLIIDTDAAKDVTLGMDLDDDLAILMALADDSTRVLDITVTYGNAPAHMCLANVKRLLRRVSAEHVPVHLGTDCTLPVPYLCSWAGGMDAPSEASRAIVKRVMQQPPGTVTLLALGPLTNIAAAFRANVEVATRLKAF